MAPHALSATNSVGAPNPSVPSIVRLAAAPARQGDWVWPLVAFLVTATGTFVAGVMYGSTPSTAIRVVHIAVQNVPLTLHVGNRGDRLEVTWNGDSTAVRTAASGSMHIQDGSETTDLSLDLAQIASGAVAYKPISHDVSFRLDLKSKIGPAEASLRVLDSVPPVRPRSPEQRSTTDESAAYDELPSASKKAAAPIASDEPTGQLIKTD